MSKAPHYDPALRDFATPQQAVYLDAVIAHGGERPAARALGVGKTTIAASLARLKLAAAARGYAPEYHLQHPVAPGQMLKGTSTLFKDGVPVLQWVKTRADADQLEEIMREAAAAMAEELPRAKPVKAPRLTNAKLANLYTLTDSHVGMLAWHKENLAANGDWDLSIAERVLTGCFEHMVDASPPADVGIVAQLGDWMHSDGLEAKTPTSGHILDQDGRFPKVVAAAIRILRRVVDFSLRKHRRVIVLLAEGNHDLASSVWLRAMFKALYEKEPRVEVIDSELPYYAYQHGSTMLAWHHGHLKKNDQLPLLFAAQFPKMWGDTTKRYAHTGHRHHVEEKEHPGMQVVQHSTLASRDAYAARGGWMSERQCTAITYHSEFGQVCRNTVTPEMLEAA
jgi:hypothetical protein